jgi:hypothetical protein
MGRPIRRRNMVAATCTACGKLVRGTDAAELEWRFKVHFRNCLPTRKEALKMSNGKTNDPAVAKQLAEANLNAAMLKARSEHLSRVASCSLFSLDILLNNDHDRLSVAASVFGLIAARGKGTVEEMQKVVLEAYNDQVKNLAAQEAARAPTASVVASEPAPTPPSNVIQLA